MRARLPFQEEWGLLRARMLPWLDRVSHSLPAKYRARSLHHVDDYSMR